MLIVDDNKEVREVMAVIVDSLWLRCSDCWGCCGGALGVIGSQWQSAVEKIKVAIVTMRDGGNVPFAAYYEAQLPKARALFNRLISR
jgi:hypothetical protein